MKPLSQEERDALDVAIHEAATYLRAAIKAGDEAATQEQADRLYGITEELLTPERKRPKPKKDEEAAQGGKKEK